MKSFFLICAVSLLSLLNTACIGTQLVNNSSPVPVTEASNYSEKCRKEGGQWMRGGILMFYGCLRPAKDAGKSCTTNKECQYGCIATPGTSPRPGQKTAGQCQKNNSHAGCRIEIKNGVAQPEHCVTI